MTNWYKKAYRGGLPRAWQRPEERRPTELTRPSPFFGGNERQTGDGTGYPRDVSRYDDPNDDKSQHANTGQKEIPSGRTILDDEIPIGEGVNDQRFSDPVDKFPQKSLDPVGPHNMQRGGIFDSVAKRTRTKSVNRV